MRKMILKNKILVCLLLVLSLPALTTKAGGNGTIELAEESSFIFFFNDLAEGDQIQYSFSAPTPIDICFTTRTEATRIREGHSGECVGAKFPFGQILNALEASGTFEIPNIRVYDDDWAVVLTNNDNDQVNVTYQLDLIATYVSGIQTSVRADTFQNNGIQEIDQRGGAFGILFGLLEAGSSITYEFSTTEPLDLYILTEEEWTLLESHMGWRYSYSDIETMRGQGEYSVPINAKWVIAFVNYNNKHISLNYYVTAEPAAAISDQSNQRSKIVQDSKTPEEINPVEETPASEGIYTFETSNPPMVQEFIYFIPILLFIPTTVALILVVRVVRGRLMIQ